MNNSDAKSLSALGFLTVVDHPQHGLFGGYLVLNTLGRPIEFHCTAPIKPNRAQEILYGPTLQSFLYGEQIGLTLLKKATTEPFLVCTDQQPALAVREHVSLPVVLVLSGDGPATDAIAGTTADTEGRLRRIDAAHKGVPKGDVSNFSGPSPNGPPLVSFQLGRNQVAVSEQSDDDRRLITERVAALPQWFAESFDLVEPFARIRDAIEEAQQAAR